MKKLFYVFTIIGFVAVSSASAQSIYDQQYSQETQGDMAYRSFDAIKRDIAMLLKENHVLEDRYRDVEADHSSVKQAFDQKRAEVDSLRDESGIILEKDKNNQYAIKSIYGDIETLKSEILIKKSRISHLHGQILAMEEKQDMWEAQLKKLKNEELQMEMDAKGGQLTVEDIIRKQKQEIANLQKEVGELNVKRDELFEKYKSLAGLANGSPDYIKDLKNENALLKKKISVLQKERDLLFREQDHLSKKQKIMRHKIPGNIGYNEEYEKELSREVSNLEERYRNLNATLQNKINRAERFRELSQEFVAASKANQELRRKLGEIK